MTDDLALPRPPTLPGRPFMPLFHGAGAQASHEDAVVRPRGHGA